MSGSKMTEISDVVLEFERSTVRYCELLFADGVTFQRPVLVAFDANLISAQVGSFRSFTAYA